MAEESSESLMRYLNGEITVFEWLEVGADKKSSQVDSQSSEICTTDILEKLLKDDDDDNGDDDDELADDDEQLNADANESEDQNHGTKAKLPSQESQDDKNLEVPMTKKMTELLLDLPAAKKVQKNRGTGVDEFLADIPLSRKRRTGTSRRNAIPHKLRQQMGEANILCAKGEYEKAKALCMDIIKLVPKCPEPFQTLGMICEMQGQMDKALQFFLIAAYLSKSRDVEEWLKLAGMSLEQNDFKQALACYNQALKNDPENVSVLWDRAALQYQMKEHKKAIDGYDTILKLLPMDCPEKFFDVSIEMAMIYHEDSCLEDAIGVMTSAFEKYPDFVDYRAVNLLAELQMTAKNYTLALKHIFLVCNFTQQSSDEEGSGKEEPLSSFSNLMGYDINQSPKKPKAAKSTVPNLSSRYKWVIPESVPIDIRVKAAVCLINVHVLDPVKTLMSPLFKENIDEVGDLYLDIAEAYADTGEHNEALPILDTLVLSSKYNQAAVWLKKAQCLMSLGRLEEGVMAYNQVVTLAPNHLEARLTLSSLHQQLGQPEQALDILSEQSSDQCLNPSIKPGTASTDEPVDSDKPTEAYKPQDFRLMFHKCVLLESQNRVEEFVDAGLQLFSMYFKNVYFNNPDESERYLGLKLRKRTIAKKSKSSKSRKKKKKDEEEEEEEEVPERKKRRRALKDRKKAPKDDSGTISRSQDDTGIRVEEWWDMLKKVIIKASSIKRHQDAEHLVVCGLNSNRLTNCKEYQRELEFMSILALCLTNKFQLAFDYARNVMNTNPSNQVMWNIMSALVCHTEDLRHHRYCMRLSHKYPDNINLVIMNAHNAFVAGSYKFAIAEYINAFRQDPQDPFLSLCLGIQYVHIASQKFPRGRHMVLVQGILFLFQYLALRGECQEAFYNIGRAFHQLGLVHFAVHYYQKALDCPFSADSTDGHSQISEKYDLHREVAFNLSLIYRASGNFPLARQVLYRYVTI